MGMKKKCEWFCMGDNFVKCSVWEITQWELTNLLNCSVWENNLWIVLFGGQCNENDKICELFCMGDNSMGIDQICELFCMWDKSKRRIQILNFGCYHWVISHTKPFSISPLFSLSYFPYKTIHKYCLSNWLSPRKNR
jgi:hypothetical protein